MVGHHAIPQQSERVCRQGVNHDPLEGREVFIFLENAPPAHAPIQDVKDDPARCPACGTRHERPAYNPAEPGSTAKANLSRFPRPVAL
jgi:hypothetical protein